MIEVFFATNRNLERVKPEPVFGPHFNTLGPHEIRYGWAEVAKKKGEYKLSKVHLAEEKIPESLDKPKVLGSRTIYETLRQRMQGQKKDVLCLLHGYASDFDTAMERGAELKDKYGDGKVEVFVFSWPADGSMVPWRAYYSDRNDAKASATAIARSFLKLRDFVLDLGEQQQRGEERLFCDQKIHLVAHSMGNYALRNAVKGIRAELGDEPPRILDNVFLMAADEDDDTFEHDHKMRLLPRLAASVHVYHARNDRALVISDLTKGNPDRLGADGPRLREGIPRKVVLIDCQNVVDVGLDDLSLHQYYRLSDEVVADVRHVLSGRPPIDIPGREPILDDRSFRLKPAAKKAKARPRKTTRGKR